MLAMLIFSAVAFLDWKKIKEYVPPTVGIYNPNANKDKWEVETFVTHKDEEAKWTEKLRSLFGNEEDIHRRMTLATVQFKSLEMLWSRSKCMTLRSHMRAYDAFGVPVLSQTGGT